MRSYINQILLSILAILAPIKPVLITVGILIIVDLVFGVMAAKRRNEPITSAGLRRTVSKILIYNLTIISGFICEKYLLVDLIPVTKLIAGIIGTVEIKSILENGDTANGESIFKKMIEMLGSSNDEVSKK